MAFCPFYNLQCPEENNGEIGCALWDTGTSNCIFKLQVSLLQALLEKEGCAILSTPPPGEYKITDIYHDPDTEEDVVTRLDTPQE